LEFGSVTRWVNDGGGAVPEVVDMSLGPGGIHHHLLTESPDDSVQICEAVVVKQFSSRESTVVGHKACVVES
jgi:hypothetical protein